jgi:hypothetical protein
MMHVAEFTQTHTLELLTSLGVLLGSMSAAFVITLVRARQRHARKSRPREKSGPHKRSPRT